MNYIMVVFIIGLLILVHELGHFLAGRAMKIPIAVFSIGFGPKIAAWKYQETEFRISWIPLGGYVLPALESEEVYFKIPIRKRLIFSLGGPVANILLPILLFAIFNCLQNGITWAGLFIQPWAQTLQHSLKIILTIPILFSHPEQLSGVVGIVNQGAIFIAANASKSLLFIIIISLNLAVLNLLPIPGLDGGKIFLSFLERIHPHMLRWQIPITMTGLVLLFGLIIYITVLDIQKFFI